MNLFPKTGRYRILLISAVWWLIFFLLSPLGNIPMNDDWSYAYTVKALSEAHQLKITNWMSGPMATQIFWGYLFCLPFGFSFTALKISTWTAGWIGLVFTYLILENRLKHKSLAIAGTFLIAVNPLFLSLGITFMSEVHFYVWFSAGLWFYIKYLQKDRFVYWFAGTFFAALAILTKQFAVLLPASFAGYFLLERLTEKSNKSLKKYGYFLTATAAVLVIYGLMSQWMAQWSATAVHFRPISEIFHVSWKGMAFRIFIRTGLMLMELGLWLLPISLPIILKLRKSRNIFSKGLLITIFVFLPALIRVFFMFPDGNIFNDFYLGTITTYDVLIVDKSLGGLALKPFPGFLLRLSAFIGALLLLTAIYLQIDESKKATVSGKKRELNLWGWFVGLYWTFIMISPSYFDRYSITVLLPLLLLLTEGRSNLFLNPWSTIAMILAMAVFSVAGTLDYIKRTHLQWELIEKAQALGYTASEIDGGHEYNGWLGDNINSEGKWETDHKQVMVSYSVLDGYRILRTKSFRRPFSGSVHKMYLLKKEQKKQTSKSPHGKVLK